MNHWAENYLGKPWQNGAAGPDTFDCYGLVRAVYADQLGVELPVVVVDAQAPLAVRHTIAEVSANGGWVETADALRDYDVVLMGSARHPHHVGVWVEGGMLHAVEGAGVVHQSLMSLKQHGWNIVRKYRRQGVE